MRQLKNSTCKKQKQQTKKKNKPIEKTATTIKKLI